MESELELHQISGQFEEEAPPPSYYASLHSDVKITSIASQHRLSHPYQQEHPPTTNWFVRSCSEPSTWQLLASGSLLSNATTSTNKTPTQKRRYRILYPPHRYEEVYLHRPPWTSQENAFPPHHVEVYSGRKRYNPEPIVVLGPSGSEESSSLTSETRALASVHVQRVLSAVEKQVAGMTRQATFAEMEFFSSDWVYKTAAAKHDMRTMILRAREECARSVGLVLGLESFLAYVGGDARTDVLISLGRSCKEVRWKLGRLSL